MESNSKLISPFLAALTTSGLVCGYGDMDQAKDFMLDTVYRPLRKGMFLAASDQFVSTSNLRIKQPVIPLRFVHLLDPSPLSIKLEPSENITLASQLGIEEELLSALNLVCEKYCIVCDQVISKPPIASESSFDQFYRSLKFSEGDALIFGVGGASEHQITLATYLEMFGSERVVYKRKLLARNSIAALLDKPLDQIPESEDLFMVVDSYSLPLSSDSHKQIVGFIQNNSHSRLSRTVIAHYSHAQDKVIELIKLGIAANCKNCGSELVLPRALSLEKLVGNQPFAGILDGDVSDLSRSVSLDGTEPPIKSRLNLLEELGLGHLKLLKFGSHMGVEEVVLLKVYALLTAEVSDILVIVDQALDVLTKQQQRLALNLLEKVSKSLKLTIVILSNQSTVIDRVSSRFEFGVKHATGASYSEPVSVRSSGRTPNSASTITFNRDLPERGKSEIEISLNSFVAFESTEPLRVGRFFREALIPWLKGEKVLSGSISQPAPLGAVHHFSILDQDSNFARSVLSICGAENDFAKAIFQGSRARMIGLTEKDLVLSKTRFRCPNCAGMGVHFVGLDGHIGKVSDLVRFGSSDLIASGSFIECHQCNGRGYPPEFLSLKYRGQTLGAILHKPLCDIVPIFTGDRRFDQLLSVLDQMALSGLRLGERGFNLSRSQYFRIRLGAALAKISSKASGSKSHYLILEHIFSSLSREQVQPIAKLLQRLVDCGASLFLCDNNCLILESADNIVCL